MSTMELRSRRKRKHEEPEAKEIRQKVRDIENELRLIDRSRSRNRSREHRTFDNKKSRRRRSVRSRSEKNLRNCCCCCERSCRRIVEAEKSRGNTGEEATAVSVVATATSEDSPKEATDGNRRDCESLVEQWTRIVKDGYGANEIDELSAKYRVVETGRSEFCAPRLNLQVRSLVDAETIRIDEAYASIQNQTTMQMCVVEKILAIAAHSGERSAEESVITERLNDIGRSNANIHHALSIARRQSIIRALEINNVDEHNDIGENLFSLPMEELFWKQKIRLDRRANATRYIAVQRDIERSQSAPHALTAQGQITNEMQRMTRRSDSSLATLQPQPQEQQQQRVVAKIEGTRIVKQEAAIIAKEEASVARITPGVPSENEHYPGAKVVVKRALQQRGVPEKFPQLAESTWRSYEPHIRSWWTDCQKKKKDVAEPSAKDVLDFYQALTDIGKSLVACRPALRRVIPENVAFDPMILNFYEKVKREK